MEKTNNEVNCFHVYRSVSRQILWKQVPNRCILPVKKYSGRGQNMPRLFRDVWAEVIAAGVLAAMTSIIGIIQDANPIIVAIIAFVIILLVFRVMYYFQERKLKSRLGIEKERWNKLREEKIRQRQIYTERKQIILDTLLKMDKYLAGVIEKQDVSASQFVRAFKKVWRGRLLSLFTGTFTFMRGNQRRFLNYKMKLTIDMLARINTAFRDYNLGTLVAINKPAYKSMDEQIRELENGFSLKVINDINQTILYTQTISCMGLIKLDRPFWSRIKINTMNESAILTFKTALSNTQWQIANILDNARGQVAEDIDKYLLGED